MSGEKLKDLPGPSGLPFMGSLTSLATFREITLMKWAEESYGDIFQVKLGSTPMVAIQGYDALREALVEKAGAFSGRLENKIMVAARDHKGLFFKQYDELWKKWRNFSKDALKDIWNNVEKAIVEESNHFKQSLGELQGENDIKELVTMTMGNIVMQTCFSRRYDVKDKELFKLVDMTYASIRDKKFSLFWLMPWVGTTPCLSGFYETTIENRKKDVKTILNLVDQRLGENRSTIDLTSYFAQAFPEATTEDRESLALLMIDFIFAGSATTAATFLWTVLFLVKNPESYSRLQAELDRVLSDCEDPVKDAISCKYEELNYTRAVLEETFRIRPIAPGSLFHYVTEDTSLMGYKIPKGLTVIPNLWSVHHDKEFWKPDPESFRPLRHLDASGCFVDSGHVIPFGIGWRTCVGQQIARRELFAHIVNMFYHYDVTLSLDDVNVDMAGVSGSILQPQPYKISLKARK